MKRFLIVSAFLVLTAGAGCVSIYDSKVQVQPPGQVDQYKRNILDQCTPHVYPHRLIQATGGVASLLVQSGGQEVNNQADFDKWWNSITPQLDQHQVVTSDFKPVVDWSQQTAFFLPMNDPNSCMRWKPFGDEMVTDCYNTTILVYQWQEGENCQNNATTYPVYVYIYPKSQWPVNYKFIVPTPTPTPADTATAVFTPTAMPTPTETPAEGEGE